jgi:hypothetical protein
MKIDTALTPKFDLRRKVASQQMMILSAVRQPYGDVYGRYQSMMAQTNLQRQMKPHHSPWIESECHDDRYSSNTNSGSVGEEKWHHSRL